jgi:2-C-methyl-D-erythritol 4-phosphate cytidylyltransferase
VPREKLWRALTPQMFRFELLQRALQSAVDNRVAVTDEAQAIEALGLRPKLVAGDADNVKITLPEDLPRAERILRARSAA